MDMAPKPDRGCSTSTLDRWLSVRAPTSCLVTAHGLVQGKLRRMQLCACEGQDGLRSHPAAEWRVRVSRYRQVAALIRQITLHLPN